jgi:hypothetical protein
MSETLDYSFADFHNTIHITKCYRNDMHLFTNYYYTTFLSIIIHSATVKQTTVVPHMTREASDSRLYHEGQRRKQVTLECLLQ